MKIFPLGPSKSSPFSHFLSTLNIYISLSLSLSLSLFISLFISLYLSLFISPSFSRALTHTHTHTHKRSLSSPLYLTPLSCFVFYRSVSSFIFGEYLGLRGMRIGSGEGSTMRNFIVCTVHLI